MGKINFGLIRSKNPDVANENIEEIESLNLSDCEITAIENLELFHHIKELNLHNNRIKKLEELLLMSNLQILDVSNNLIESEGLRASMSQIPRTLLSINLSGNPCVSDFGVLEQLQDMFPDLVIATEEETAEHKDVDQMDTSKNEGGEEHEDVDGDLNGIPLNADDVLKMIVDRKCKLQNLQPVFNLQNTVQQLNEEMEKAIETTNNRKIRLLDQASISQREESTKKRIDELLESHRSESGSAFEVAMERIKLSAFERLQGLHNQHVHDLEAEKQRETSTQG